MTIHVPGDKKQRRIICEGFSGPGQGLPFDSAGVLYVANYFSSIVTLYAPRKKSFGVFWENKNAGS